MMTLHPPPERDLPARRDTEIRAALARVSAPARPRRTRWVIAVAAALLVVAATLGIPRLIAAPEIARPAETPSAAPVPTTAAPTPTVPSSRPVDRGPLGRTDREALIMRCQHDLQRHAPVQAVLYARDTTDGPAALVRDREGSVYGCSDSGSSLLAGPDSKSGRLPTAGPDRPVASLSGPGFSGSASGHRMTSQAGGGWWAVSDEVAVLQLRLRHEGDVGPWFGAAIHDGFAYGATAPHTFTITSLPTGSRAGVEVDVRAYGDDGRAVDLDGGMPR